MFKTLRYTTRWQRLIYDTGHNGNNFIQTVIQDRNGHGVEVTRLVAHFLDYCFYTVFKYKCGLQCNLFTGRKKCHTLLCWHLWCRYFEMAEWEDGTVGYYTSFFHTHTPPTCGYISSPDGDSCNKEGRFSFLPKLSDCHLAVRTYFLCQFDLVKSESGSMSR